MALFVTVSVWAWNFNLESITMPRSCMSSKHLTIVEVLSTAYVWPKALAIFCLCDMCVVHICTYEICLFLGWFLWLRTANKALYCLARLHSWFSSHISIISTERNPWNHWRGCRCKAFFRLHPLALLSWYQIQFLISLFLALMY